MEGSDSNPGLIKAEMDRYKGVMIKDMNLLASSEVEFETQLT